MAINAILLAAIGALLFSKPETIFVGSKVTPTPKKLESARKIGKYIFFLGVGFAVLSVLTSL
jgi:hypothetical protein